MAPFGNFNLDDLHLHCRRCGADGRAEDLFNPEIHPCFKCITHDIFKDQKGPICPDCGGAMGEAA